MRDATLEEILYFNFTTRDFSTGVPTQLAGSPVLSVLESNNATPITSGVSVQVDRASVTGLNQATVAATSANGYEAGKSYAVYISTGTVGGVSVVGEVVAEFTLQASAAFTRLGTPAGASISADIAAIEAQTDDIGTAGAGLTAVPWNAAWDAEVQSEVADALAAYGAATATDVTNAAANVSVDEIQATALADLFNTDSGTDYASAVAGSVVKEIADNAGGSSLTAADIADAVWDEAISGHAGSGSTGEALAAAGGAGDPWITPLPGSYSAGQAGKIVGDFLDAAISSRASQASVDDLPTNAELAAALADADDAVLAQVALVKAQTDLIPASPAAVGDIPTAIENADALLNRDMAAVSDTNARSPLNALRHVRNRWDTTSNPGFVTVRKEDDTTEAWRAALSTDSGAEPITGSDPT